MGDSADVSGDFEREKWLADLGLRRGELALKQRQQEQSEEELALKRRETERARWTNPLVVAVFAAAIAGLGNAAVTMINGVLQRDLEQEKSVNLLKQTESTAESGRILEVIKTGDTEKAATNLQFLVDAGLITSPELSSRLQAYLVHRKAGAGPSLPTSGGHLNFDTSPGISSGMQSLVADDLNKFLSYMSTLGFPDVSRTTTIHIDDREGAEASYFSDDKSGRGYISIDKDVALDVDLPRLVIGFPLFQYNRVGLNNTAGQDRHKIYSSTYMIQGALIDYYAASLEDRPTLGLIAARIRRLETPYVYNMDNHRQFSELPAAATLDLSNIRLSDEVWGGVFWEIRRRLGQNKADIILAEAWRQLAWPTHDEEVPRQFVSFVIAATRLHTSDLDSKEVAAIFRSRGFPS